MICSNCECITTLVKALNPLGTRTEVTSEANWEQTDSSIAAFPQPRTRSLSVSLQFTQSAKIVCADGAQIHCSNSWMYLTGLLELLTQEPEFVVESQRLFNETHARH
jgi:hypothetical protein